MAQLRLKNTLLKVIPLVFIGAFFIFNTAWATTILSDDFEAYNTGQDLGGQGDWWCSAGHSYQPTISEDKAQSGVKSVKNKYVNAGGLASCGKTGNSPEEGSAQVWLYLINDNCQDVRFYLSNINVFLGLASDNGICKIRYFTPTTNYVFWEKFTNWEEWFSLSIAWKVIDSVKWFNFGYNNVWSDWIETEITINPDNVAVSYPYRESDGYIYFDTIKENPPPISGIEPILTPTTPPNCEKTVVDYSNISITGNITIPKDNLNTYDLLIVNFEDLSATGTIKYLNIDLPNLTANQSFNYSATTTLPVLKGYRITYTLFGYDTDGKVISENFACPCLPPFWCFDTLISAEFPLAPELLIQYGEYAEATSETCTSTNLMERLTCDIKNILQSLILPSQSKIGELKQNVGLIKQKFPMNYLMVASNFFSNVRSGVNSTSTISLKVFGQSGNLDFSIWDKTANIASTSQKFSDIFSGFFGLIFIGGFLTWAILFSKRIFK